MLPDLKESIAYIHESLIKALTWGSANLPHGLNMWACSDTETYHLDLQPLTWCSWVTGPITLMWHAWPCHCDWIPPDSRTCHCNLLCLTWCPWMTNPTAALTWWAPAALTWCLQIHGSTSVTKYTLMLLLKDHTKLWPDAPGCKDLTRYLGVLNALPSEDQTHCWNPAWPVTPKFM